MEIVTLEIEARVASDGRPEVPSTFVGELAMDALHRLDHIAYIRFASVYRAFADIESLKEAVEALETGRIPTLEEKTLQLALPGDEPDEPGPPAPRLLHDAASRRHLAGSVT